MKMRNMRLLVLFLASLGGVQSVSAGDFKASTHLKSNRHAYAALFAALGATNLAYLFATGKLDKTKLKRLLSKEQRAATLQLVAPSLAALLLAGGVEAYGYGYREEGGKPKDNDVPVRASALDIINQPALAEISQPSVKPEAVVEAPLIGRATSPTSIALPEVSSKPAPSGVLRSATPPCVTAIPGDERREGGDKPKGNDSAGALRITAPSTPVTVDLSESVSQSSSSVSESEEDISDDFEGEEEGLLGCEEAMYALESDFADSQSVALKGLAAKITALRAERRSGIVLRDRVRAFMRMNVHSLSGLTSEELQALLEFLILDAEVYDAYRKSVPEAGLHRCLEAHVYEAYRLIRLAQREGCVLPEEVSAALQDRSTLLKSEIGDVGGELSFALSFASTVTDEGVWSGFALERLFQEEESKRLAEQFESHPDSLPFITLPEVTSAGAGGPPVTQVTPVRAVTPPVAASVAVGPTPSHAPGVQTPVDVASGSAVVVPGLLAEERPVAFTADAVDPAPSSVTPGDGEIPSDVYFSNFKKNLRILVVVKCLLAMTVF